LSGGYRVVPIHRPCSFGFGVNIPGVVTNRPGDVLSAGITQADFNHGPSETSHELVYQFELNRRLALQADYQYIRHPSGRLPDAQVVLFRLNYSYDANIDID